MTSKERYLKVLHGEIPDRLPVTTHHIMPYFLNKYLNGKSNDEFFDYFGLDPIKWVLEYKPGNPEKEYFDPDQGAGGFLEARRISTDNGRIEVGGLDGGDYMTSRFNFITPKKRFQWFFKVLIKHPGYLNIV